MILSSCLGALVAERNYAAFAALAALLINIILGPSDWTASVTVFATSTNFVDSAEEIHE